MKVLRQTHRLLLSTRIRSIRFSSSIATPAVDTANRGGISHRMTAVGGLHPGAPATVPPKQQPTTSADGVSTPSSQYIEHNRYNRDNRVADGRAEEERL